MKNLRWKKEGENWFVLEVKNPHSLTDDQALKVQEMQDNKHFQGLQEHFNKMIILLTGFVVLFGIFEFVKFVCNSGNCNIFSWFSFFAVIFLILALSFLYLALPEGIIINIRNFFKIDKIDKMKLEDKIEILISAVLALIINLSFSITQILSQALDGIPSVVGYLWLNHFLILCFFVVEIAAIYGIFFKIFKLFK